MERVSYPGMRSLVLLILLVCSLPGWAYNGPVHQQVTFIAARQFNNCAHVSQQVPRFSALDTRYIVKSNVSQAEANVFVRMFRWNYYNRADQSGRKTWGFIDTRFHDHFEKLVDETHWAADPQLRLQNLGRILNYIQDMTSPARVVPVYTGRWWRFSVGDRFDKFPVKTEVIERAVENMCAEILGTSGSFQDVLEDTANQTIRAVQSPIYGFPTTWEAYWRFASEADEFGDYGPAGNTFGDRTSFKCNQGTQCLLLEGDPLYQDFATTRHIAAVISSMRAMALIQFAEAERNSQTTAR